MAILTNVDALVRRHRTWGHLAVLGLYLLVALITPLLHHDVACHMQSKSHCDACTASSVVSRVEVAATLTDPLAAIDMRAARDITAHNSGERLSSPGRAPPGESASV